MTRAANSIATLLFAAIATVSLGGCASWRKSNQSVIRVEASQNTAKAARLTSAGIKALAAGKIDLAEKEFLAAVDADLAYGPAHNNLGLMHFEQGNLYQSVLAFEHAMEYMPQDPTVLYNLGLTLESAGKIHEALDLYMQAAEMDPVNPNFLGNLVRLRIRMGDHDPSLVAQLQDLVLIETRPEWRSWADHQLAIRFNPILDRGPETPDFNLNRDSETAQDDRNIDDQIIDLTPNPEIDESDFEGMKSDDESANQVDDPALDSASGMVRQENSVPIPKPMPIYDDATIDTLPPSIQMNPDDLPIEMDYFR